MRTGMRRGISLFVAVTFFVTSILGSPSNGAASTGSMDFLTGPGTRQELHRSLYAIPEEMGRLTKLWEPSSVSAPPSFVIHIQDAHANPEAARNITSILRHLEKDYPDLVIGLEGAQGALHPEYLRFFHKFPEANHAVIEDLRKKGELNAAELFLLEKHQTSDSQSAISIQEKAASKIPAGASQVTGIENAALYRENLKTYQDLLSHQGEIQTLLTPIRSRLETESSQKLNPELRDFLKERSRRKEGRFNLLGASLDPDLQVYFSYLQKQAGKTLEIDLSDFVEQLRFPNLVRFAKMEEARKKINTDSARSEWAAVLARLDLAARDQSEKEFVAALRDFGQAKGFLDSPASSFQAADVEPALYPRKLLEGLFYFSQKHGLAFEKQDAFFDTWKLSIFQAEIEVSGLLAEMGQLEEALIQKLARSDAEKDFILRLDDFSLMEKLLRLELTRPEYDVLLQKYEAGKLGEFLMAISASAKNRWTDPSSGGKAGIQNFIKTGSRIQSFRDDEQRQIATPEKQARDDGMPNTLASFFTKAFHFYEVSLARDQALVDNLLSQMSKRQVAKTRIGVLYSGGFHSQGIEDLLRQKGIGYATIAPAIHSIDHGERYAKVMSGENADLSAYFKIKNPFSTKQEAIFFKELLEVGAPALFEKYKLKPETVAAQIREAGANHSVLSKALSASVSKDSADSVVHFQTISSSTYPRPLHGGEEKGEGVELSPEQTAVMPEALTSDPVFSGQSETRATDVRFGEAEALTMAVESREKETTQRSELRANFQTAESLRAVDHADFEERWREILPQLAPDGSELTLDEWLDLARERSSLVIGRLIESFCDNPKSRSLQVLIGIAEETPRNVFQTVWISLRNPEKAEMKLELFRQLSESSQTVFLSFLRMVPRYLFPDNLPANPDDRPNLISLVNILLAIKGKSDDDMRSLVYRVGAALAPVHAELGNVLKLDELKLPPDLIGFMANKVTGVLRDGTDTQCLIAKNVLLELSKTDPGAVARPLVNALGDCEQEKVSYFREVLKVIAETDRAVVWGVFRDILDGFRDPSRQYQVQVFREIQEETNWVRKEIKINHQPRVFQPRPLLSPLISVGHLLQLLGLAKQRIKAITIEIPGRASETFLPVFFYAIELDLNKPGIINIQLANSARSEVRAKPRMKVARPEKPAAKDHGTVSSGLNRRVFLKGGLALLGLAGLAGLLGRKHFMPSTPVEKKSKLFDQLGRAIPLAMNPNIMIDTNLSEGEQQVMTTALTLIEGRRPGTLKRVDIPLFIMKMTFDQVKDMAKEFFGANAVEQHFKNYFAEGSLVLVADPKNPSTAFAFLALDPRALQDMAMTFTILSHELLGHADRFPVLQEGGLTRWGSGLQSSDAAAEAKAFRDTAAFLEDLLNDPTLHFQEKLPAFAERLKACIRIEKERAEHWEAKVTRSEVRIANAPSSRDLLEAFLGNYHRVISRQVLATPALQSESNRIQDMLKMKKGEDVLLRIEEILDRGMLQSHYDPNVGMPLAGLILGIAIDNPTNIALLEQAIRVSRKIPQTPVSYDAVGPAIQAIEDMLKATRSEVREEAGTETQEAHALATMALMTLLTSEANQTSMDEVVTHFGLRYGVSIPKQEQRIDSGTGQPSKAIHRYRVMILLDPVNIEATIEDSERQLAVLDKRLPPPPTLSDLPVHVHSTINQLKVETKRKIANLKGLQEAINHFLENKQYKTFFKDWAYRSGDVVRALRASSTTHLPGSSRPESSSEFFKGAAAFLDFLKNPFRSSSKSSSSSGVTPGGITTRDTSPMNRSELRGELTGLQNPEDLLVKELPFSEKVQAVFAKENPPITQLAEVATKTTAELMGMKLRSDAAAEIYDVLADQGLTLKGTMHRPDKTWKLITGDPQVTKLEAGDELMGISLDLGKLADSKTVFVVTERRSNRLFVRPKDQPDAKPIMTFQNKVADGVFRHPARSELRAHHEISGKLLAPRSVVGTILPLSLEQKIRDAAGNEQIYFHWYLNNDETLPQRYAEAKAQMAAFIHELTTSYQGNFKVIGSGKKLSDQGLLAWIFPPAEAQVFSDVFEEILKIQSPKVDFSSSVGVVEHPLSVLLTFLEKGRKTIVEAVQTEYDTSPEQLSKEQGTSYERADLAVTELLQLMANFVKVSYLTENGKADPGQLKKIASDLSAEYIQNIEATVQMLYTTVERVAAQEFVKETHQFEQTELEHLTRLIPPGSTVLAAGASWDLPLKQTLQQEIETRFQSLRNETQTKIAETQEKLVRIETELAQLPPDTPENDFSKKDLLKAQKQELANRRAFSNRQTELAGWAEELLKELDRSQGSAEFRRLLVRDLAMLSLAVEKEEKFIQAHKETKESIVPVEGKLMLYQGYPSTVETLADNTPLESGKSVLRLLYDHFSLGLLATRQRRAKPGEPLFVNLTDSAETGRQFLELLMAKLEVVEPLENKKPVAGQCILVVPPKVTDQDVARMLKIYGSQIVGIVGLGATSQTHWILIVRSRLKVPILLVSAENRERLMSSFGTPAIILDKPSRLILNPTQEELIEESKRREFARRLELGQKRMLNLPSTIGRGVNLDVMETESDLSDLPVAGGLLRTDTVPNPQETMRPETAEIPDESMFRNLETLAESIALNQLNLDQWFSKLNRSELRMSELDTAVVYAELMGPGSKSIANAQAIHQLLKGWTHAFERVMRQKAFIGQDVPLRTLDLQADSKGLAVLTMLEKIIAGHPASTLKKNPVVNIKGFDFYENSSLGELMLVLQLAAMIIAESRVSQSVPASEKGRLVPLFPLIKTHAQFEWIRKTLWPRAQQIAMWEMMSETTVDPAELGQLKERVQKIGQETRFGIMVEYLSLLTDLNEQEKFLQDPFVVRFNVGNNDLWKDYWETTEGTTLNREESSSAPYFDKLPGDLMEHLRDFLGRVQKQSGKKVCFCGGIAEVPKFLLATEWWRRQLGIQEGNDSSAFFSVSVTGDVLLEVNHALQVFRGISTEELRGVFDVSRESNIMDGRAEELANRYLEISKSVSVMIEEWQERYADAGFHYALYRSNVDPEKGIGSLREFLDLRKLLRAWLALYPEDLAKLDLQADDKPIKREEAERMLGYLVERKMMIAANVPAVLDAFDFIDSVQKVREKLRAANPGRFSGYLYPKIMGEVINAWAKVHGEPEWLLPGRLPHDSPEVGDRKEDERIDSFYQHYHAQIGTVFFTVRRTLHEIDSLLVKPLYTQRQVVATVSGVDIVEHIRQGLTMSRERGRKGETATYLHVPDALENFRRHPEVALKLLELVAEHQAKGESCFISHRVQWAIEEIRLEGGFNPPELKEQFNRSFKALLTKPADIAYAMWREDEYGFLDQFVLSFAKLDRYALKNGGRYSLQMQTLSALEILEHLYEREKRFFAQRAQDVWRQLRPNPELAMLTRLSILLHPVIELETRDRFTFSNVKAETGRILADLEMHDPALCDKFAWVLFHLHPFAQHGFLSAKDIERTVAETIEDPATVDRDVFSVLYLAAFSRQLAQTSPESRPMLARQGADSPLADLDRFFLAGIHRLNAFALQQEHIDAAGAMAKANEIVSQSNFEEKSQELIAFCKTSHSKQILEDYLAHTPGGQDTELRERLSKGIENPDFIKALFQRYHARPTSTYYMSSMNIGDLLKHLLFYEHLLFLREKKNKYIKPMAFFPLSSQYQQAYEVLMGSPGDDYGTAALFTRVLYEHSFFAEHAAIRNPVGEPAIIRFLGYFPNGEDMAQAQKQMVDQVTKIFAPLTRQDHLFRFVKSRDEIPFQRADEIYNGPIRVSKRDAWRGDPSTAQFGEDLLFRGRSVSVLKIHSSTSDWRGQLLVLLTVLSRIHGLDIVRLQFEQLKGITQETQVYLAYPSDRLISADTKEIIGKDVARILDLSPITIRGKEATSEELAAVSKTFTLNRLAKLHSRPAVQIAQILKQAKVAYATLRVREHPHINLKMPTSVLAAAISGDKDATREIEIVLEGEDPDRLKAALQKIQTETNAFDEKNREMKLFAQEGAKRSEVRNTADLFSNPGITEVLTVKNKLGIHAGPAAQCQKVGKGFSRLAVFAEKDGEIVDGKNIMALMMLAAGPGAQVTFKVTITEPKGSELNAAEQQMIRNYFVRLVETVLDRDGRAFEMRPGRAAFYGVKPEPGKRSEMRFYKEGARAGILGAVASLFKSYEKSLPKVISREKNAARSELRSDESASEPIHIPAATPEGSSPNPKPAIISIKRILVADDEEMIRELIATILKMNGFEVMTAVNGLDALAKIGPFRPHAILSDYIMPGLRGSEWVLRAVAEHGLFGMPIVFISGYSDNPRQFAADQAMLIANGYPVHFLTKPFQNRSLVQLFQEPQKHFQSWPGRLPLQDTASDSETRSEVRAKSDDEKPHKPVASKAIRMLWDAKRTKAVRVTDPGKIETGDYLLLPRHFVVEVTGKDSKRTANPVVKTHLVGATKNGYRPVPFRALTTQTIYLVKKSDWTASLAARSETRELQFEPVSLGLLHHSFTVKLPDGQSNVFARYNRRDFLKIASAAIAALAVLGGRSAAQETSRATATTADKTGSGKAIDRALQVLRQTQYQASLESIEFQAWKQANFEKIAPVLAKLSSFAEQWQKITVQGLAPEIMGNIHRTFFQDLSQSIQVKTKLPEGYGLDYVAAIARLFSKELPQFFAGQGLVFDIKQTEISSNTQTEVLNGIAKKSTESFFPSFHMPEKYFLVLQPDVRRALGISSKILEDEKTPLVLVQPVRVSIGSGNIQLAPYQEPWQGGQSNELGFANGTTAFLRADLTEEVLKQDQSNLQRITLGLFAGDFSLRDVINGIRTGTSTDAQGRTTIQIISYPIKDKASAAGYAALKLMVRAMRQPGAGQDSYDFGPWQRAQYVETATHEVKHVEDAHLAIWRVVWQILQSTTDKRINRDDIQKAEVLIEQSARLKTLRKTPAAYLKNLLATAQAGGGARSNYDKAETDILAAVVKEGSALPGQYGVEIDSSLKLDKETQVIAQLYRIAEKPERVEALYTAVRKALDFDARAKTLAEKYPFLDLAEKSETPSPARSEVRLIPAVFDLSAEVPPEQWDLPIGMDIVADNTGTFTKHFSAPQPEVIRDRLLILLSHEGNRLIMQTGDDAESVMRSQGPVINHLTETNATRRWFITSAGGTIVGHLDTSGRLVSRSIAPVWSISMKVSLAKALVDAFYQQVLSGVDAGAIYLDRLTKDSVQRAWGMSLKDIRAKNVDWEHIPAGENKNIVTYLLPEFFGKQIFIYDSGAKMALDAVEAPEIYDWINLGFFEALVPKVQKAMGGEKGSIEFIPGFNFLDVSALTKWNGVQEILSEVPADSKGKLHLTVRMGDGLNDLPVLNARMKGSGVSLAVALNHHPAFADRDRVADHVYISKAQKMEAAAEILLWLTQIQGKTVRQLIKEGHHQLFLQKWQRSEVRGMDTLEVYSDMEETATPLFEKQQKTMVGIIEARLKRTEGEPAARAFREKSDAARAAYILAEKAHRTSEETIRAYFRDRFAGMTEADMQEMVDAMELSPDYLKVLQQMRERANAQKIKLTFVVRGYVQPFQKFLERKDVADALEKTGVDPKNIKIIGNTLVIKNGIFTGELERPVMFDKARHIPKDRPYLGDPRDRQYGLKFLVDIHAADRDQHVNETMDRFLADIDEVSHRSEMRTADFQGEFSKAKATAEGRMAVTTIATILGLRRNEVQSMPLSVFAEKLAQAITIKWQERESKQRLASSSTPEINAMAQINLEAIDTLLQPLQRLFIKIVPLVEGWETLPKSPELEALVAKSQGEDRLMELLTPERIAALHQISHLKDPVNGTSMAPVVGKAFREAFLDDLLKFLTAIEVFVKKTMTETDRKRLVIDASHTANVMVTLLQMRDMKRPKTMDPTALRRLEELFWIDREGSLGAEKIITDLKARIASLVPGDEDAAYQLAYVTVFLHDVGKVFGNANHERTGAELLRTSGLMKPIIKRKVITAEQAEWIRLAIKHHLLLALTYSGDFPDNSLASFFKDPETYEFLKNADGAIDLAKAEKLLNLIHILTAADTGGVRDTRGYLNIRKMHFRQGLVDDLIRMIREEHGDREQIILKIEREASTTERLRARLGRILAYWDDQIDFKDPDSYAHRFDEARQGLLAHNAINPDVLRLIDEDVPGVITRMGDVTLSALGWSPVNAATREEFREATPANESFNPAVSDVPPERSLNPMAVKALALALKARRLLNPAAQSILIDTNPPHMYIHNPGRYSDTLWMLELNMRQAYDVRLEDDHCVLVDRKGHAIQIEEAPISLTRNPSGDVEMLFGKVPVSRSEVREIKADRSRQPAVIKQPTAVETFGFQPTATVKTDLARSARQPAQAITLHEWREPIVQAAVTMDHMFSERGVAAMFPGGETEENLRLARQWVAAELKAIILEQAGEMGISNERLQAILKNLSDLAVTGKVDQAVVVQGPGVHANLPAMTEAQWQDFLKQMPVVLGVVASLRANLYFNVVGSPVEVQKMEEAVYQEAARNGIGLAQGQIKFVPTSRQEAFASLKLSNWKADAVFASDPSLLPGHSGNFGTRWTPKKDLGTNAAGLAADIATVLYAALDVKLKDVSRGEPLHPEDYNSGTLMTAILNAIQGYVAIRQAA